jgi:succinate-semialdehyde dehydrogenase/glutarate-semialdehyde dehydrogenase
VKKVSMELGGNAPFIVFDDADLDRRSKARSPPNTAIPARPASAPTASSCRPASTTPFVEKFAAGAEAEGRQWPRGTRHQQGPLIDEKAVEKVEEHSSPTPRRRAAKSSPAASAMQARRLVLRADRDRRAPPPDMMFMKEEIFGPLAPVFRFETEEEAIARQRHRVRPRLPTSIRAISAAPSASWKG